MAFIGSRIEKIMTFYFEAEFNRDRLDVNIVSSTFHVVMNHV